MADDLETRPITVLSSQHAGRSRVRELVRCPFCNEETWTFLWSRCGSGKKCSCGALLGGSLALRKVG